MEKKTSKLNESEMLVTAIVTGIAGCPDTLLAHKRKILLQGELTSLVDWVFTCTFRLVLFSDLLLVAKKKSAPGETAYVFDCVAPLELLTASDDTDGQGVVIAGLSAQPRVFKCAPHGHEGEAARWVKAINARKARIITKGVEKNAPALYVSLSDFERLLACHLSCILKSSEQATVERCLAALGEGAQALSAAASWWYRLTDDRRRREAAKDLENSTAELLQAIEFLATEVAICWEGSQSPRMHEYCNTLATTAYRLLDQVSADVGPYLKTNNRDSLSIKSPSLPLKSPFPRPGSRSKDDRRGRWSLARLLVVDERLRDATNSDRPSLHRASLPQADGAILRCLSPCLDSAGPRLDIKSSESCPLVEPAAAPHAPRQGIGKGLPSVAPPNQQNGSFCSWPLPHRASLTGFERAQSLPIPSETTTHHTRLGFERVQSLPASLRHANTPNGHGLSGDQSSPGSPSAEGGFFPAKEGLGRRKSNLGRTMTSLSKALGMCTIDEPSNMLDGLLLDIAPTASRQLAPGICVDNLAMQLCLRDATLFSSIAQHEFLDCGWSKRSKETVAPTIMSMIRDFDRTAMLVASEVVRPLTPDDRARVIERFIKVAERLHAYQNFNSLKAVLCGLQSQAVFRLAKTWGCVSVRRRKSFNRLVLVMAEDSNYSAYREELCRAQGPCIPYLGVYLTDLTYIHIAYRQSQDDVHRRVQRVLEGVHALQRQATYSFKPRDSILTQAYLECTQAGMDKENYELSLLREPKKQCPVPKKSEEERGRDSEEALDVSDDSAIRSELANVSDQCDRLHCDIAQLGQQQDTDWVHAVPKHLWVDVADLTRRAITLRHLLNQAIAAADSANPDSTPGTPTTPSSRTRPTTMRPLPTTSSLSSGDDAQDPVSPLNPNRHTHTQTHTQVHTGRRPHSVAARVELEVGGAPVLDASVWSFALPKPPNSGLEGCLPGVESA